MVKDSNETTFLRITNKDIYKEIVDLKESIQPINTRSKLNRKLIAVNFTLLGMVFGLVLSLI